MLLHLISLFTWLPWPFGVLLPAVIGLFFFVTVFRIIRFILDLIPFA